MQHVGIGADDRSGCCVYHFVHIRYEHKVGELSIDGMVCSYIMLLLSNMQFLLHLYVSVYRILASKYNAGVVEKEKQRKG